MSDQNISMLPQEDLTKHEQYSNIDRLIQRLGNIQLKKDFTCIFKDTKDCGFLMSEHSRNTILLKRAGIILDADYKGVTPNKFFDVIRTFFCPGHKITENTAYWKKYKDHFISLWDQGVDEKRLELWKLLRECHKRIDPRNFTTPQKERPSLERGYDSVPKGVPRVLETQKLKREATDDARPSTVHGDFDREVSFHGFGSDSTPSKLSRASKRTLSGTIPKIKKEYSDGESQDEDPDSEDLNGEDLNGEESDGKESNDEDSNDEKPDGEETIHADSQSSASVTGERLVPLSNTPDYSGLSGQEKPIVNSESEASKSQGIVSSWSNRLSPIPNTNAAAPKDAQASPAERRGSSGQQPSGFNKALAERMRIENGKYPDLFPDQAKITGAQESKVAPKNASTPFSQHSASEFNFEFQPYRMRIPMIGNSKLPVSISNFQTGPAFPKAQSTTPEDADIATPRPETPSPAKDTPTTDTSSKEKKDPITWEYERRIASGIIANLRVILNKNLTSYMYILEASESFYKEFKPTHDSKETWYKIGIADDVDRRAYEIGTVCKIDGLKSVYRSKHKIRTDVLRISEAACHEQLNNFRRKMDCGTYGLSSTCKQTHKEWFAVPKKVAEKTVMMWEKFAKQYPYGKAGYLQREWSDSLRDFALLDHSDEQDEDQRLHEGLDAWITSTGLATGSRMGAS